MGHISAKKSVAKTFLYLGVLLLISGLQDQGRVKKERGHQIATSKGMCAIRTYQENKILSSYSLFLDCSLSLDLLLSVTLYSNFFILGSPLVFARSRHILLVSCSCSIQFWSSIFMVNKGNSFSHRAGVLVLTVLSPLQGKARLTCPLQSPT